MSKTKKKIFFSQQILIEITKQFHRLDLSAIIKLLLLFILKIILLIKTVNLF